MNKAYDFECYGHSPRNTVHLSATARTRAAAEAKARQKASELVQRRPETGPLEKWRFTPSHDF